MDSDEHLYEDAFKYIEEKLLSFFGISEKANADQYQKFHTSFTTAETKKEIQTLFHQSKKMLLVSTNKDLVVLNQKDPRKKTILILKTNKEEGLVPDMTKNFLFIELSRKTLNQMYILCNDIFFPLLTQNVQQPDTSELISKELMEKFHNFLSHFYVALGQTEGKTRLPEPSDEIFRNDKINDNEKTQICEGAIVMWIDLIRFILKQEPEHDFRNNGNPLPISEINFWKQKSTDLNSILEQIKKKKIADILKFLEKQKSTYHRMFTEIQKDVERAAKESDHNYKYLRCLEDSFTFLDGSSQKAAQADFPDIVDEFVPIFHFIRQIWNENADYAKHLRAGVSQGFHCLQNRARGGYKVLYDYYFLTRFKPSLYLVGPAVVLGRASYIAHGKSHDVSRDRRVGNTCGTCPHKHFNVRIILPYHLRHGLLNDRPCFRRGQGEPVVAVYGAFDAACPCEGVIRS